MNKTVQTIRKKLFDLKDEKYADFQAKLTPEKPRSAFIGVRTPALKILAKEFYKSLKKGELNEFLSDLPHEYFEENNLHGFIISEIKDFNECVLRIEDFLPHVDNWATCDQTIPAVFKKNAEKLLPFVQKWLESEKTYVKRYAIGCLMRYFLGENFKPEYADAVAAIKTDEYYVIH